MSLAMPAWASSACSRLYPMEGDNTGPNGIDTKYTSDIGTVEVGSLH